MEDRPNLKEVRPTVLQNHDRKPEKHHTNEEQYREQNTRDRTGTRSLRPGSDDRFLHLINHFLHVQSYKRIPILRAALRSLLQLRRFLTAPAVILKLAAGGHCGQ
jgi:hypothetical protein